MSDADDAARSTIFNASLVAHGIPENDMAKHKLLRLTVVFRVEKMISTYGADDGGKKPAEMHVWEYWLSRLDFYEINATC
jgi:hypothetical protein